MELAFSVCVKTSVVPTGLASIFQLPSTPPAAACWAKLFRAYGAGFFTVVLHYQFETLVLTQTRQASAKPFQFG